MKSHPDPKRHLLRGLVATLEKETTALDGGGDAARAACVALVAALDLGPDPAVRTCPKCGGVGMAGASVCGHCWTPLSA